MQAENSYREFITLTDGSQIYGYVSKDNLNTGEIEICADWTITSVPSADIDMNSTNLREYQLDSNIKEWLTSICGNIPEIVSMASITMTGEDCNNAYLIYDQVLSQDSDTFDMILLEDGDIIKYANLEKRKYKLDWKKVERIDRFDLSGKEKTIEEIIDSNGHIIEGFIETQVLRHHRVLCTPDGRKITFLPKSISSIKKRTIDPKESLLSVSPIIESLELEHNVGIDKLDGVIIENNRKEKYFIILTNSDDQQGDTTKKVRYADTKAIIFTPK